MENTDRPLAAAAIDGRLVRDRLAVASAARRVERAEMVLEQARQLAREAAKFAEHAFTELEIESFEYLQIFAEFLTIHHPEVE